MRPLAGREEFHASERRVRGTRGVARAGVRSQERSRLPEARARQEAVLEAVPGHRLELAVPQTVGERRAKVLVGEIDARHAFVVRGQGHRDSGFEVHRERVPDIEDHVVAGEAHLDEDAAFTHVRQELQRAVFVGDVDPMSDPAGVSQLHCLTDVEAQVLRRHEAERQLTRMHGDVDPGRCGDEEVQHLHVLGVTSQRNGGVLRRDEVDAHNARVRAGELDRKRELGEYLFQRRVPRRRLQVPDRHSAARGRTFSVALHRLPAFRFHLLELTLSLGNELTEPCIGGEESAVRRCIVRSQTDLAAELTNGNILHRDHQLDIEGPLIDGSCCDLCDRVADPEPGNRPECTEGRKELVVTGASRQGQVTGGHLTQGPASRHPPGRSSPLGARASWCAIIRPILRHADSCLVAPRFLDRTRLVLDVTAAGPEVD